MREEAKLILIKSTQIIEDFLNNTQKVIDDDIEEITCDLLGQIYFQLFNTLKLKRGISANFVGYGEYIVFCATQSVLGGEWLGPKKEDISEQKSYVFKRGNLELSQGYRYKLIKKYPKVKDGKPVLDKKNNKPKYQEKFEPDVSLWQGKELLLYFSIKTWFQRSIIMSEITFLKHILDCYPQVQIVLMSIDEISDKLENDLRNIKEQMNEADRISIISLRGNPMKFIELFNENIIKIRKYGSV